MIKEIGTLTYSCAICRKTHISKKKKERKREENIEIRSEANFLSCCATLYHLCRI